MCCYVNNIRCRRIAAATANARRHIFLVHNRESHTVQLRVSFFRLHLFHLRRVHRLHRFHLRRELRLHRFHLRRVRRLHLFHLRRVRRLHSVNLRFEFAVVGHCCNPEYCRKHPDAECSVHKPLDPHLLVAAFDERVNLCASLAVTHRAGVDIVPGVPAPIAGVVGAAPGLVPGSGAPDGGGCVIADVINVLVIARAVSEGAVSGGGQLELS